MATISMANTWMLEIPIFLVVLGIYYRVAVVEKSVEQLRNVVDTLASVVQYLHDAGAPNHTEEKGNAHIPNG